MTVPEEVIFAEGAAKIVRTIEVDPKIIAKLLLKIGGDASAYEETD